MPEHPPAAAWRRVEIRYPFGNRNAVGPVDIEIRRGERVLLLGPSGSGKSTLLLSLTGLVPRSIPARVEGDIALFGSDVRAREPWECATRAAQFFQDADQTLCGMRVEDEIAFALENRAMPPERIAESVKTVMRRLKLPENWRRRRTSTLSGGEKQLVALAATLVQDASLFVADEPTAHLAPEAASRLHALLMSLEPDRSVLIVDHRLDGLIATLDRVVVLGRGGTLIAEGPPRRLFREKRDMLISHGVWCPASSALDAALAGIGMAAPVAPLSVDEALAHLDPEIASRSAVEKARPIVQTFVAARSNSSRAPGAEAQIVAELIGADCAPFLGPTILRNVNLVVREGEVLGILGANGAGKSTLAACLAGLLALRAGKRVGRPGGIAFQKPDQQFAGGSVRDEIAAVLPGRMTENDRAECVARTLEAWRLAGLESSHPLELSQGQKRRLTLATLTVTDRWPLLVLDEPMAGLDAHGASVLTQEIAALQSSGRAIAIVTHDMDLALKLCTRVIVIGEGGIMAEGPTVEILEDAALLRRSGLTEPSCAAARRWLKRAAEC